MKEFLEIYGNIISAGVIIIGWGVVAWFNRRNAIAIERAKHRIEALRTVLNMTAEIDEREGNLTGMTINIGAMQLFSYDDEWRAYEKFLTLMRDPSKGKESYKALRELTMLAHTNIRHELKYKRNTGMLKFL